MTRLEDVFRPHLDHWHGEAIPSLAFDADRPEALVGPETMKRLLRLVERKRTTAPWLDKVLQETFELGKMCGKHGLEFRFGVGDGRVKAQRARGPRRGQTISAEAEALDEEITRLHKQYRETDEYDRADVNTEELRRFINVGSETDFCLMATWLIQALRPRGPYPILVLVAGQGAAKTTTARSLRRLCDPSESDVRRPPRNTEDLMIAATNGHIVNFDNLSRLSPELSDNLAVLATGGGFSVRQLYTNNEEMIFDAQHPIILNGMSQVATRGDLLDRAVVITLPPIADAARKDEATFWQEFDQAQPRMLGALLDAVVCGLGRRSPYFRLRLARPVT